MDTVANDKKISWPAPFAGVVTLVTLVGSAIGIVQYYQQKTIHDITGTWTITDKTAKTSYSPYQNLEVTYTVTVTQSGSDFTGSGTKTTESGHPVIGRAHTPIQVKGKVVDDQIVAYFTEEGTARQSTGGFNWKLTGDRKWAGTFYSDAANSSGASALSQ
ncbi:MAG: hypothetical protein WCC87_20975 [Candidatus Korobacteraceae bacterium]